MTVLIPGMTGDRERVEIRPESEHVSLLCPESEHAQVYIVLNRKKFFLLWSLVAFKHLCSLGVLTRSVRVFATNLGINEGLLNNEHISSCE